MEDLFRRINYIFRSGVLYAGIDHFLAMFPATVLVPVLINNYFRQPIVDVSLVLLASGIGTFLFLIITKGKVPAFLGSSFAFIALTIYLISDISSKNNLSASDAYLHVIWAYVISSVILFMLSYAYKFNKVTNIMGFLLPPSVLGPSISLIGLELASIAATDAGFGLPNDDPVKIQSMTVALITLTVIILASITRRTYLRNASIVLGVVVGYLLSKKLGLEISNDYSHISVWSFPKISIPTIVPSHPFQLLISVIPATVVIFAEHLARVTVINQLITGYTGSQEPPEKFNILVQKSLRGHATSVMTSAVIGSVPTTIYAENIAVMSINSADAKARERREDNDRFIRSLYNPLHFTPFVIAATFAIAVSFFEVVRVFLMSIPRPVIGGVELFLFGIIAAPGIQLLVEYGVNFRKLTNQILMATVLVAGVSGFSFNFGIVELKGMGLGMALGVTINLLFKLLEWFGLLNERVTFLEALGFCFTDHSDNKKIARLYLKADSDDREQEIGQAILKDLDISGVSGREIHNIISSEYNKQQQMMVNAGLMLNYLKYSLAADIVTNDDRIYARVEIETDGSAHILTKLPEDKVIRYNNDYPDSCNKNRSPDYNINIRLDGYIPPRKIKRILKEAFESMNI